MHFLFFGVRDRKHNEHFAQCNSATVERWKSELAKYNVSEWLECTVDGKGKVNKMKCKFCISYEDKINDMPNFSNIRIAGSVNCRKSAVEEHARKCKPHTRAYDLFLKSKGTSVEEAAKTLSASVPNNSNIVSGVMEMEKKRFRKNEEKV